MSHLSLLLLLSFLCLSVVVADTIVSDNFGDLVGLPLSGGNATGGFTISNSRVSTSPYILSVFINDEVLINPATNQPYPGQSSESFFILPGFSAGNLTKSTFQASTLISNVAVPTGPVLTGATPGFYLGTAASPNSAMGVYVFTFTIPVNQTLTANISYNNTINPTVIDRIFISMFNPIVPTVVGDPQFIGLRGQSYQVHGVDGAVYNIISEVDTQVNSRFIFLSQGSCPTINGVVDTNCWSHPGSYLGELSYQQRVAGKIVTGLVTAGTAKHGFAAIQYNGKALKVGDSVMAGDDLFSMNVTSTHTIDINTEHFFFTLSNSDLFINQVVRPRVPLSKLNAHGLLGQTHVAKVYNSVNRYIEGSVDDYVIEDDDIFGNLFVYNQFNA